MIKRNFIVIISITIFLITLKSQTYVPLSDSNAIWSVAFIGNKKFIPIGDSIVNNLNYKKYYCAYAPYTSSTQNLYFFGLLRQDLTTKKVFAIPSNSTVEKLIYNFNLNVNDTVRVQNLDVFNNSGLLKVTSKDSILINGNYRKRLNLKGVQTSFNYVDSWIEGIGSTFGLFNSATADINMICGCLPKLICFQKNQNIEYTFPMANNDCDAPFCNGAGLMDNFDRNSDFNYLIYPNPTNSKCYISISESASLNLIITNCLGQQIIATHLSKNINEIDLSEYPKGLYFINVSDGKSKKYSRKLIVE